MTKYLKYGLLLVLCNFLTNCERPIKQETFDRQLWNKQFDFGYVHREQMLVDLVNNYLRPGISKSEVVELLGQPNNNSSNVKPDEYAYFLNEEYSWADIDPTTRKHLILTFNPDSTLNEIYKRTWKTGEETQNEKLVLTSSPI